MNFYERCLLTKKLLRLETTLGGFITIPMLIALFLAFLENRGVVHFSYMFGAPLFFVSMFFTIVYFIVYFINDVISNGRAHPTPPHQDWDREGF